MRKSPFLIALIALCTFTFVGCDSDEDEYNNILGRWEALGDPFEPDVYLNISDDDIVVHFFNDEEVTDTPCFVLQNFDVVSRDGNAWTLRIGTSTEVVIFRRDGDALVTESPDIEDGDRLILVGLAEHFATCADLFRTPTAPEARA